MDVSAASSTPVRFVPMETCRRQDVNDELGRLKLLRIPPVKLEERSPRSSGDASFPSSASPWQVMQLFSVERAVSRRPGMGVHAIVRRAGLLGHGARHSSVTPAATAQQCGRLKAGEVAGISNSMSRTLRALPGPHRPPCYGLQPFLVSSNPSNKRPAFAPASVSIRCGWPFSTV